MQILSVVELLGSGIVAGVLFSITLAILPTLLTLPADRYTQVHQLINRNLDRAMPLIVPASAAIGLVLAFIAPTAGARTLFAVATALLIGVGLVSSTLNVPINRWLARLDPNALPAEWQDPRPRWRKWHYVRYTFATLALIANAAAVVSLWSL
ncbi:MAG: anthrone oxygenase family protein [Egibacteraceae bacterium]